MHDIKIIANKTSPLCYLNDGRLVCYCQGRIILYKNDRINISFPLFVSKKEKVLGWSRMATRFFRFGVRYALALDSTHVLLSIGNHLREFNIETGEQSQGWNCGEGTRPLTLTKVEGIDGFDNGVYYGEYKGVLDKNPISVYRRKDIDKWVEVYRFNEGEVDHIHNIVPDPYRKCLWIFSGDFGNAAAIWKVSDNFKQVEKIAYNNQCYRGCVAFALQEGLLYATDAPFTENYIYKLNPETLELKKIIPIHGSCIYGSKIENDYAFSSTVEGNEFRNKKEFFFSRKRGDGIKDDYVHLYLGNLKEGFKEIYKEKKDCLPLYSFQFGVFKFPSGINGSEDLYMQSVATITNDQKLLKVCRTDKQQ